MPFKLSYDNIYHDGDAVMDGTEVTIFEITRQNTVVNGYLDLTAMQAGDSVEIRLLGKNDVAGAYVEWGKETKTDLQAHPLMLLRPMQVPYALKWTAKQIAGVNRTFHYSYSEEIR